MEERNITVTLNKAREWFNNGNVALKEVALQAFSENELKFNFRNITSFKKACEVLDIDYDDINSVIGEAIMYGCGKSSAAKLKLNIIRKALNLGYDLQLTKNPENSYIYYPYNPFVTKSSTYYKSKINSGEMEVIGKIKSKGEEYNVLGGSTSYCSCSGLGYFCPSTGTGYADFTIGFLGCANKEIAQHLGKYFGMLITEAKYGDIPDFEIINNCTRRHLKHLS